jgi:hypothetical protein
MEAGGIPQAVKGRQAAADTMDTVPDENLNSTGPLPHQCVKRLVTVDFVSTCHRHLPVGFRHPAGSAVDPSLLWHNQNCIWPGIGDRLYKQDRMRAQ